jgi:hypothetical protein
LFPSPKGNFNIYTIILSNTFSSETMFFNENTVLNSLSYSMIATGAVTYVACTYITAPYGRHVEKKGWGVMVPARLSWFVMESPNLSIPLYMYSRGLLDDFSSVKWILLSLFLMHYVQRSVVYPLFRVSGKYHQPLPISVPFLAFCYCSWNAVTQVLSLIFSGNYP